LLGYQLHPAITKDAIPSGSNSLLQYGNKPNGYVIHFESFHTIPLQIPMKQW
jgi:hypothetical protein